MFRSSTHNGNNHCIIPPDMSNRMNREIARGVSQKGGRTILTGKQDPASFARELLNRHEADFCRISVHQNVDEMMRLRNNNHFRVVVPYHCREKLVFEEPDIAVLEPGDSIEI